MPPATDRHPAPTGSAQRAATIAALRARINALAPPRSAPIGLATGWPALEAATGGWPSPGISLIEGPAGTGRLQAVWPALARLCRAGRRVAVVDVAGWLHPPGLPGLPWQSLLVVRPGATRALWATEQLARCSALPLVLLLDPPPLGRGARRLERAASAGGAAVIVISEAPQRDLPRRLHLDSHPHPLHGPGLRLRKGGVGPPDQWLPLPAAGPEPAAPTLWPATAPPGGDTLPPPPAAPRTR